MALWSLAQASRIWPIWISPPKRFPATLGAHRGGVDAENRVIANRDGRDNLPDTVSKICKLEHYRLDRPDVAGRNRSGDPAGNDQVKKEPGKSPGKTPGCAGSWSVWPQALGINRIMKKLTATLAVVILFSGCGGMRTCDVVMTMKPEAIVVIKKPAQGPIHSLSIIGHGEVQGKAGIALILNGEPYMQESLSGDVDFRWKSDWYSDQAEIRYTPLTVNGGHLTLTYQFHD